MFFICILYDFVEVVHCGVDVCDGVVVQCFEVLFCLASEFFPTGSFVVRVGGSVARRGESCFGGDYDWEVVRG